MADRRLTRRDLLRDGAAVAAGAAAATAGGGATNAAESPPDAEPWKKTRSYNPNMEYRRLGKTGAWVSAVCLGGHWKRINTVIAAKGGINPYAMPGEGDLRAFHRNRRDVVARCLEMGINYIDACTGGEVLTYAKALKGKRDKVFLGYSWSEKESRSAEWRSTKKLLQGLDEGLKAAGLEYVDLWRVTMHERGRRHSDAEVAAMIRALEKAQKQGKCRFTGFSCHDRPWIKTQIEKYPEQVQVIVTPYTASSRELPKDSLFETVRKHDVGMLGIKPFASNSLFKGDSSPKSPHAAEDDKRARLAIRHILGNPALTAPIPGLITLHQVDNVVQAVRERRKLDRAEKAELKKVTDEMWANLPEGYEWLRDWQNV